MDATDKERLEENIPLLLNDSSNDVIFTYTNEKDTCKKLQLIRHGAEREIRVMLVVEQWRLAFYLTFMLAFVVAVIITKVFVEGDFAKIMRDVFGTTNVCVYIDFPPTTYVMPTAWSIALLFMYGYIVASLFRVWVAKEEGKISHTSFVVYVVLLAYVAFSFIFFGTVFAVKPNYEDPHSILVHTIPYFNWNIAMLVLYVIVTWFGEKVAWTNMDLHPCLIPINRFMVGVQAMSTVGCVVMMINSLGDEKNGLWWRPSAHAAVTMAFQVNNYVWLLAVIVWPTVVSGYLTHKGHQTHCVYVSFQDNREARLSQLSQGDDDGNIP